MSISQPSLAQIEVIIPLLELQERIAAKVQGSLATEQEARYLLEEAKHQVEMMVDGEVAHE